MGRAHLWAANQGFVYSVQCLLCSPGYVCCPKCKSCNRLLKSAWVLSWHSSLWHPSPLHLFTNCHILDGIGGCEKWEKVIKLEADAHSKSNGSFNLRSPLTGFLKYIPWHSTITVQNTLSAPANFIPENRDEHRNKCKKHGYWHQGQISLERTSNIVVFKANANKKFSRQSSTTLHFPTFNLCHSILIFHICGNAKM